MSQLTWHGLILQSAPIAASGFGGVVCASLESLLVEVELFLETVEAVCKLGQAAAYHKHSKKAYAHKIHAVDISYESLIGVLADQVDTQFEVAIGAFCLA